MESSLEIYDLAREFAISTNRNIFLTGKAGTGKTTFLRKLKQETRKQVAVVAPTGVAAINAGGTTMHSFFQLPLMPFVPTNEGRKGFVEKIRMQNFRRKVIQELELLVIDEVSMVRADLLDAVDAVLRHIRHKNNEPFGGVQVLFIGDMFQLPPVVKDDEWQLLSNFYQSPYFFHSQVVMQQPPVYIEFGKIFRQTNMKFIGLLNEIRNDCLTPESLAVLQQRYKPEFLPPKDDTYIILTTHNNRADRINNEELLKVQEKSHFFEATISGDFPEKNFPAEQHLELKIGAKVMFIKNDAEKPSRFFNGKIGIVSGFEDDKILIKCPDNENIIELGKMSWENMRYTANSETHQIEEETLGTFVQYPLCLAWAITIHKSQGLTFDKAIIDAGFAFASGQVYVALSRCRSLEGLVLWSKINPSSITNDRIVVEHEKTKLPIAELEKQLDNSKNEFRLFVLKQLFDFRTAIGLISRLLNDVTEVKTSFNEETMPFLKNILLQLKDIQDITEKFSNQLHNIFNSATFNEDLLTERLQAASEFFKSKLANCIESVSATPAQTDSRDNARDYDSLLANLYGFLEHKLDVLKKIKLPFEVENYFDVKNSFRQSDFKPSSYARTGSKKISSKNPKLYFLLLELRNKLCEPENLPIYLVANSKTLLEMADYLPSTDSDLLNISGFGPAKVAKYGYEFLKIINKYAEENNLKTQMPEKAEEKKKEKKEKGESFRVTLQMYRDGKNIAEIAKERNLAESTIGTHISKYVNTGELNINDFISAEKLEQATQRIKTSESFGSVLELLSDILDKSQVAIFLGWQRAQKQQ
jgi:HRDC domain./PIF1 helicase.